MKILQYRKKGEGEFRLGTLGPGSKVFPATGAAAQMLAMDFIEGGTELWNSGAMWLEDEDAGLRLDEIELEASLFPRSIRDFYAFEEHVATAHANREKEVPAEWYQIPVFYFSNPNPVFGHEQRVEMPSYTHALDFELEVAAIIGKGGRDIAAEKAEEHIFGYTIFNDWSARDVQRQEMKVGLGPAKGKDFASSLGPWIVSADELAEWRSEREGVFDLEMRARINGEEVSTGNWGSLHFSFGEMIARASEGVDLYPGEVIGSGTVGTGCLLELTKGKGPWLKRGDQVELEIEGIGKLRNAVS